VIGGIASNAYGYGRDTGIMAVMPALLLAPVGQTGRGLCFCFDEEKK
jgi:hypothetical protein